MCKPAMHWMGRTGFSPTKSCLTPVPYQGPLEYLLYPFLTYVTTPATIYTMKLCKIRFHAGLRHRLLYWLVSPHQPKVYTNANLITAGEFVADVGQIKTSKVLISLKLECNEVSSHKDILKILRLTLNIGSRSGQRSNFEVSVWWGPRACDIDSFCSKLSQSNFKGLLKIPCECEHKCHTKYGSGSGHESSPESTILFRACGTWFIVVFNVELKN